MDIYPTIIDHIRTVHGFKNKVTPQRIKCENMHINAVLSGRRSLSDLLPPSNNSDPLFSDLLHRLKNAVSLKKTS